MIKFHFFPVFLFENLKNTEKNPILIMRDYFSKGGKCYEDINEASKKKES